VPDRVPAVRGLAAGRGRDAGGPDPALPGLVPIQRKGAIAAYARKVVVSTTLDGLRRKSSQEVVGGEEYFVNQTETADPLAVLERRMVITQALAQLPPRQRACVVLRYFDELSVEETASVLDCRPGR
jgi:RNA polymerase sigma factor (sigma-70 family)